MSTNVTEKAAYSGVLTFTTVVNGSAFDVKLNGTTVVTATAKPLSAACLYARSQNYPLSLTINLIEPLVGGGTRQVSCPITEGLSENGPTYG